MTVAVSMMLLDGKIRPTCGRCSDLLFRLGMLEIVFAWKSLRAGDIVLYQIAPGLTLEECKVAVSASRAHLVVVK